MTSEHIPEDHNAQFAYQDFKWLFNSLRDMKYLFLPIGIHKKRLLKTISTVKPDRIILLIPNPPDNSAEPQEDQLQVLWWKALSKVRDTIIGEISMFYPEEGSIQEISVDLCDYSSSFKEIVRQVLLIRQAAYDLRIYIDITSVPALFRIAATTVAVFLPNVHCVYTDYYRRLAPEEYSRKGVEDPGGSTNILYTPILDLSEIQRKDLIDVLNGLRKENGRVENIKGLLPHLKVGKNPRSDAIRTSKLVIKLEKYGCVSTHVRGRCKQVELTPIGHCLAEIL